MRRVERREGSERGWVYVMSEQAGHTHRLHEIIVFFVFFLSDWGRLSQRLSVCLSFTRESASVRLSASRVLNSDVLVNGKAFHQDPETFMPPSCPPSLSTRSSVPQPRRGRRAQTDLM